MNKKFPPFVRDILLGLFIFFLICAFLLLVQGVFEFFGPMFGFIITILDVLFAGFMVVIGVMFWIIRKINVLKPTTIVLGVIAVTAAVLIGTAIYGFTSLSSTGIGPVLPDWE